MAETPPKRVRDESHDESGSEFANSKRQKPHNTILNLLDEEEEHEPSLQLEPRFISHIHNPPARALPSPPAAMIPPPPSTSSLCSPRLQWRWLSRPKRSPVTPGGGGDDVMRHLLEASDDELGIPNTRDGGENVVEGLNDGENFAFALNDNGLWELEDEAANYYTVLQSELFM